MKAPPFINNLPKKFREKLSDKKMTKKFSGELNWIKPDFLITENNFDKTESFFLGLAVIFNDLKGLLLFEQMLIDNYEKPRDDEVSDHAGNYGGVMVQIKKLIASTIHEFFEFLKENNDIFIQNEFKQILTRLSKTDQRLWNAMIAAANGKLSSVTDLLKSVVQIRSNITFHYDHSGKILRKGYISYFFNKDKTNQNKLAYYSIDEIDNTRFYFADAAVQESLFIAAGKDSKQLEKYHRQIIETIEVMTTAIASLLKNYIQSRRNRPH